MTNQFDGDPILLLALNSISVANTSRIDKQFLRDKAVEYYFKHSLNIASRETAARDELIQFESDFVEEVAKHFPSSNGSVGGATSCAKPFLPTPCANAVRGLLRARGSSAHPVPAGRCSRIMKEVRSHLVAASCEDAWFRPDAEWSQLPCVEQIVKVSGPVKIELDNAIPNSGDELLVGEVTDI